MEEQPRPMQLSDVLLGESLSHRGTLGLKQRYERCKSLAQTCERTFSRRQLPLFL